MKFHIFGFEPVRRASAAAGGGALHADLHRDVENNGQVGLEIADGDPLHRIENRWRDLAEPALIHPGRVRKPVAQHPDSLIQGRLNHRTHMIVARGSKQQRFGIGAEQLAHSGQHDMADDFGARRTAWLAGDDGA
jgi:hypothetical protein